MTVLKRASQGEKEMKAEVLMQEELRKIGQEITETDLEFVGQDVVGSGKFYNKKKQLLKLNLLQRCFWYC